MSIAKQDRSKQVDQVLAGLAAQRGVTAAAIVDSDGFVVHVRRDFEIDTDALGAGVQVVFSSAARAAKQAAQGTTSLVLTENTEGLVMLVPLASGFVLALLADKTRCSARSATRRA